MRQHSPHFRWIILAITTVTQLGAALASQGIGVWAPYAQQNLLLSNSEIGLLATLLNCVPVAGLLLVSPLLDRLGERLLVFAGMVSMSAGFLCMGLTDQYGILAMAVLLAGLGYSPIQPAGGKAIYQWFPPHERGLAMGIRQAALPLGGAFAAVFFPFTIQHAGWQTAMHAAAFIVLFVGLVYLGVYRNAPGSLAPDATHRKPDAIGLLRQSTFRRVTSVGAAMVGVQTIVAVFWAVGMRQRFDLTVQAAAWHLFAVQMSGATGRVALSAISDRLPDGRRRIVAICALGTLATLLATVILPIRDDPLAVFFCSIAMGVFGFGWYGPWVIWLSDCAGHDDVGRVLSTAMAVNQISIASAPALFGVLLDLAPNATAAWLALGCLLVAATCFCRPLPAQESPKP